MHQPACDTLLPGRKQQYRPTAASNAKLPDSFELDRPATARKLMSRSESKQLPWQAQHPPQQELPSLGCGQVHPAHSSQRAASLPRAPPSALGVFAACSDSDEDDIELLQAALEADQQLQHRVADRGQEELSADAGDNTLNSQPGLILHERETIGHQAPCWAAEPHFYAAQDHIQRSIPGIVYECSNEDAVCQAPEQLRAGISQVTSSMQACSRPSQVARRDHDREEVSLSDVSQAEAEQPASEDAQDILVFYDAQDTAWHDQPTSPQGQEGKARLELLQRLSATRPLNSELQLAFSVDCSGEDSVVMTADQAEWHSHAQHSTTWQVGSLAAAKGDVELPRILSKSSSACAVRVQIPDSELEDIHMVVDESEAEDMQQDLSRLTAATASWADALTPTESQGLHVGAHATAGPAQDQADEHAVLAEWALEDEDSEGIIFDDTTVDFTAQWMQGNIKTQATMHADDLLALEQQQPVHSNAAEAHARQKRAREDLCDKLIQVGVLVANCKVSASVDPILHGRSCALVRIAWRLS